MVSTSNFLTPVINPCCKLLNASRDELLEICSHRRKVKKSKIYLDRKFDLCFGFELLLQLELVEIAQNGRVIVVGIAFAVALVLIVAKINIIVARQCVARMSVLEFRLQFGTRERLGSGRMIRGGWRRRVFGLGQVKNVAHVASMAKWWSEKYYW